MFGFIGFLALVIVGVIAFYKIKGNHFANRLCDDAKELGKKFADDVTDGVKNVYGVVKNKKN